MPEQSPNKWKGLVAAVLTSDFPARVLMRSVNSAKWLQLRRREGEQECGTPAGQSSTAKSRIQ
jgi:hypothetical protein